MLWSPVGVEAVGTADSASLPLASTFLFLERGWKARKQTCQEHGLWFIPTGWGQLSWLQNADGTTVQLGSKKCECKIQKGEASIQVRGGTITFKVN